MKAAIHTRYDKNNITLEFQEREIPKIKNREVLVKINTAGINPLDNMISKGEVQLILPYKPPFVGGNEFVGIVEEVGSGVTKFSLGDRVFARMPLQRTGTFAEYVGVEESVLAKVPEYLTDEEAAAVPLTGLTIMQALDIMQPKSGESIFISGGTGGVGGMAIPIAKTKGLRVITNGNELHRQRVLELGADQFIDYKKEDYTRILKNVDYVLDTLGGDETEKQTKILKKGGTIVSLKAMPNGAFAKRMGLPLWKQVLFTLAGSKLDRMAKKYNVNYEFIFVQENGEQLQEVADILAQSKIVPSIDSVFSFEEINQALDKVARGHSKGKTILKFR